MLTLALVNQPLFNPDCLAYSSTASTLHDLDQFTPWASSVWSKTPPGFDLKLYLSGVDRGSNFAYQLVHLDEAALHCTQNTHPVGTPYQLEICDGSYNGSDVTTNPPAPYAAQSSGSVKRPFFCTFCEENGTEKNFKFKADWKRHEQNFHPDTGLDWRCGIAGCTEDFECGRDLKKHAEKNHPGEKVPSWPARQDWVYGCGFENCRNLSSMWKDRCDHVARCMQRATSAWSYSRTIQNLLEDDRISGIWNQVVEQLASEQGITLAQMQWYPATSREMRQRLAGRSFEPNILDFFNSLFWAGYCAPQDLRIPPANITSRSLLPTTTNDLPFKFTPFTSFPKTEPTDTPPPGNTHQFSNPNRGTTACSSHAYRQ